MCLWGIRRSGRSCSRYWASRLGSRGLLPKWLSSPALLSEGASIELFRPWWSCLGRPHAAAVAARAYAQGCSDGKEGMHFELENWQSADHRRGCGYQPCSAAKGHSPQAPGTVGVEIEVGKDEVSYGVSVLTRRPNGHQCRRLLVGTAASSPGLSALVSLSTVCCEVVRFCKTSWYR